MQKKQSNYRQCQCGKLFVSDHSLLCLNCLVSLSEDISQSGKKSKRDHLESAKNFTPETNRNASKSMPKPPPPSVKLINFARRAGVNGLKQRNPGTTCTLCGEQVPKGQLLRHKQARHGEQPFLPSHGIPRKEIWVQVFQGGLPGLGKRSK